MNRYWTRILLGALLVFGAGMVGLTVVRKGSAEVRSLLSTAASRLPLRFANVGFRLNGRRLGDVIGLDIIRNSRTETGRITGHVQLSDPEAIAELSDCTLTLEDVRRLNERTTFSCARAADLSSGELVEVGEIQFEPGSLSRPLYLPQSVVADWRRSEIQRLDASMARDGRGGVRASGSFDVLDQQSSSQSGTFDLRADSQGAVFSVRDGQNRQIVDFKATQGGLHLNVRDRHGRNLLRLLADSLGAALNIHQ
ncbi:MAG TPA: hypothetical protein VIP80_04790 [Gemmatimonadales bacterium]|jgi:hypothetical protein